MTFRTKQIVLGVSGVALAATLLGSSVYSSFAQDGGNIMQIPGFDAESIQKRKANLEAGIEEPELSLPPAPKKAEKKAEAPEPAEQDKEAVTEASAASAEPEAQESAASPEESADEKTKRAIEETAERANAKWEGSLMFRDERLDKLMLVYDAYQRTIAAKQPIQKTTEDKDDIDLARVLIEGLEQVEGVGQEEQIQEEVLNFALNSIVMHNDAEWSIWVNGERYSQEKVEDGFFIGESQLTVTNVSEDTVDFVWIPISKSYSFVEDNWKKKTTFASLDQSPNLAKGKRVYLDKEQQQVAIALSPNQQFLSRDMSVVEGRGTAVLKGTGNALEKALEGAEMTNDAEAPAQELPVGLPAEATGGLQDIIDAKNMKGGSDKERAISDALSNQYLGIFGKGN